MTDSADNRSAQWIPRDRWALLAIAAVSVTLGWLARQPVVTTGGDDATYILLAQSLAQGHYRDLYLPGTPAHAQYPPGFPLMIMAIRAVTFGSLEAVRIANLLLVVLTALLFGDCTRRLAGPRVGLLVAALVMLNPLMLHYAGWILSESLFVACMAAALWATCPVHGRVRRQLWLLAIVTAVAAFFTRSVGVAVVIAIVGGLVLQLEWRRAAMIAGLTIALMVGWLTYTRWAAGQTLGWSYQNDLAYVRSDQIAELLSRLMTSAKYYLLVIPRTGLGIPDIPDMPLDNLLWVVGTSGLTLVGLWSLRRRWPTAVLCLVLLGAVLLVFPFAIARLILPLLPITLVAILLGALEIARWLRLRSPARVATLVAGVLVTIFVGRDVAAAGAGVRCRARDGDGCRTPAERDWIHTVEWIRTGLPDSAVVASSKPTTLYLLSDRRGIPSRMLWEAKLEDVLAPRGPVTHILISGLWDYERTNLPDLLASSCERLRPVPQPEPDDLLLEVTSEPDSNRTGCTALAKFKRPWPEHSE